MLVNCWRRVFLVFELPTPRQLCSNESLRPSEFPDRLFHHPYVDLSNTEGIDKQTTRKLMWYSRSQGHNKKLTNIVQHLALQSVTLTTIVLCLMHIATVLWIFTWRCNGSLSHWPVGKVFVNGPGDRGSIPGSVVPLKWYLIPPCLKLSNIRYVSRVKWSNPGKWVTPSHTCSINWKGSLLVALDYGHQLYFLIIINYLKKCAKNDYY